MADQTASKDTTAAKKLFHGSCHCKEIRYEVKLSIGENPTAGRCNCTICLKTGFTSIRPLEEDFTLLSPKSVDEMIDYQWQSKNVHRYHCSKCGVCVYGKGYYEMDGQRVDFFSLNLLTLDQPQEGLDLSVFKMVYVDGRNNNWAGGVKDHPWPGGCV